MPLIEEVLRNHLARMLSWHDAHATIEAAARGLDPSLQGVKPAGLPYSAWQLLEHLRRTQLDILEFCRNPDYQELDWPADYWPREAAPPDEEAWDRSVASYLADRAELARMAEDPAIDLFARIPHGSGQTYLRELLLVADHNSYHIGELILLRRVLGAWPAN